MVERRRDHNELKLSFLDHTTSNTTIAPLQINPPNNESSESNLAAIIAPVVVLTIVAVALILAFLLYRRRKNRKEVAKLEPGTPSMNLRSLGNFPAISVKDHINMLTADDLLKSKMPVNDVKKIRQFPVDRVAYENDLGEGQFGQVFQGRRLFQTLFHQLYNFVSSEEAVTVYQFLIIIQEIS